MKDVTLANAAGYPNSHPANAPYDTIPITTLSELWLLGSPKNNPPPLSPTLIKMKIN